MASVGRTNLYRIELKVAKINSFINLENGNLTTYKTSTNTSNIYFNECHGLIQNCLTNFNITNGQCLL